MKPASHQISLSLPDSWSGDKTPTIIQPMRRFLRKHNAALALTLSLFLIVSGSLQLLHDQLIDHQHTSECATYMVDGHVPLLSQAITCHIIHTVIPTVPLTISSAYPPVYSLHPPRAPPSVL